MASMLAEAPGAQAPFLNQNLTWAQSVLGQLSLREKIAQLIHVATWSNRGLEHSEEILALIEETGIGGLIFFQGHPTQQAKQTNRYQAASRIPLLISIDGEWGLGMRLDETMSFPYQMTLGATSADVDIYLMGKEIARQCSRIGVHVNFAPTIDVNNNPANPVIGFRSFGADKNQVAAKSYAYMKGMQDERILAVAKHFPGHGNTDQDSHFSLPVIRGSQAELWETELFPYSQLIPKGLGGVMVAHLHVPAFDPEPNLASTLSRPIVTELLRNELGFEGITFTDAMDMKGVAEAYPPGVVDARACIAGNDVMVFCKDVKTAIEEMVKAVESGELTEADIDAKCLRVLAVKQWVGLDRYEPVPIEGIMSDLHRPEAYELLNALHRESLTCLGEIPALRLDDSMKCASLSVHIKADGASPEMLAHHSLEAGQRLSKEAALTPFQRQLDLQGEIDHFAIHSHITAEELLPVLAELKTYDRLVIAIHGVHIKARNQFGIDSTSIALLEQIWQLENSIAVVFGSPYVLDILLGIDKVDGILLAYQDSEVAQQVAAEQLCKTGFPKGKLPVPLQLTTSFLKH